MNDALQAEPAATVTEPVRLSWITPGGMVPLSIKNFLLRVVTFGIYGFWGKTEVRRRIWNGMRLNGEPLQYTGTGKELLIGFLVVFGVVMLPTMLASFGAVLTFGPNSPMLAVFQVVVMVVFFFLLGVGIHRAQRYRLSRTNWRGIRGGLDGSSWAYAWKHFWTALLLIPTLGWASPWRTTELQRTIVSDMRFGDRHFTFDAPSGPLYGRFAVLWFGALVIMLGIGGVVAAMMPMAMPGGRPAPIDQQRMMMLVGAVYGLMFIGYLLYAVLSAWYRARLMNHFAAHTAFEGLHFKATARGRGLIWLAITNFFIVALGGLAATLLVMILVGLLVGGLMLGTRIDFGAGWMEIVEVMPPWLLSIGPAAILVVLAAAMSLLVPVAQMRSARYFVEHLELEGELPLASIMQGAANAAQRGEGLAQVFDVDAF